MLTSQKPHWTTTKKEGSAGLHLAALPLFFTRKGMIQNFGLLIILAGIFMFAIYNYEKKIDLAYSCKDYSLTSCPSANIFKITVSCTGSMQPTFSCYDDVYGFVPSSREQVKRCDVISFNTPVNVNIHRVVGFAGSRYVTKGDANVVVDDYKPSFNDVKGVVCRK